MQRNADTLLLGMKEDRDTPLDLMLADDMCPISEVVMQTARLIDSLRISPLRRFLGAALIRPDVLYG